MKRGFYASIVAFTLLLTACGSPAVSNTTVYSATTTTTELTSVATTQDEITSSSASTTTKANTTTGSSATTTTASKPKVSVKNGMRGAWVSYFEIDALLSNTKTVEQAKNALNTIFDTCAEFDVNTIFFHVRANSDAYYLSSYFKASAVTKKLLNMNFDPLSYAVSEAHARGMQLHAWVNPYRIGKDTTYRINSVPSFKDGDGSYYYIPTSTAAQQLILNGVRELITNYAIDGIQYDDYFYPKNVLTDSAAAFETADYAAYRASGGVLSVADWRRVSVDSLIAATHTLAHTKGLVFGVSPAANADKTYDLSFANPKKWMSESGYVDYICPQIYSGFEHTTAAFDIVTDEWLSYPRHSSVKLYVGLSVYKAGLKDDTWAGNGREEWGIHNDILKRSVLYLRSKNITGFAFYSYSYLRPDKFSELSSTNDINIAKKELEQLRTVL